MSSSRITIAQLVNVPPPAVKRPSNEPETVQKVAKLSAEAFKEVAEPDVERLRSLVDLVPLFSKLHTLGTKNADKIIHLVMTKLNITTEKKIELAGLYAKELLQIFVETNKTPHAKPFGNLLEFLKTEIELNTSKVFYFYPTAFETLFSNYNPLLHLFKGNMQESGFYIALLACLLNKEDLMARAALLMSGIVNGKEGRTPFNFDESVFELRFIEWQLVELAIKEAQLPQEAKESDYCRFYNQTLHGLGPEFRQFLNEVKDNGNNPLQRQAAEVLLARFYLYSFYKDSENKSTLSGPLPYSRLTAGMSFGDDCTGKNFVQNLRQIVDKKPPVGLATEASRIAGMLGFVALYPEIPFEESQKDLQRFEEDVHAQFFLSCARFVWLKGADFLEEATEKLKKSGWNKGGIEAFSNICTFLCTKNPDIATASKAFQYLSPSSFVRSHYPFLLDLLLPSLATYLVNPNVQREGLVELCFANLLDQFKILAERGSYGARVALNKFKNIM